MSNETTAPTRPTDQEINALCATLCGYQVFADDAPIMLQAMSCIRQSECPDFCGSRQPSAEWLLPMVAEDDRAEFVRYLWRSVDVRDVWACMTSTPRQQVEAVLRTLGKWPAEWEESR